MQVSCFEGVDGSFRNIAAVDIRRDKLEGAVQVFNDGVTVFCTGFVIEDLEVNTVSVGFGQVVMAL